MSESLLRVEHLQAYFITDTATIRAVDDVSFELNPGETLAIVGESGSGKSVTAMSILRLVAQPPGRIVGGSVWFRGRNLLALSDSEMRAVRGREISMIFQEPMTSLNPVFTCGDQIAEAVVLHERLSKKAALARAVDMLTLVGIPAPEQRVLEYPHQLSGGMRQRVMIAMALACRPSILIADEPTTALDVTIQAQILELIDRLKAELGMAVVLITHDLGIVAEHADRVAVMYAGQVVEYGDVASAFRAPVHPYTAGLQASLPRLGMHQDRLRVIPGNVPNPAHFPTGCRFGSRCPIRIDASGAPQPLNALEGDRWSRCGRAGEIVTGAVNPVGVESRA